jgi:hypothetical protein
MAAIASSSADSSALCEHNKICELLGLRTLELEPSDDSIRLGVANDSDDFDEGPRTTVTESGGERRSNIGFLLHQEDVDTAT